jgi:tRNA (guanine-N7-)-methyltransferase
MRQHVNPLSYTYTQPIGATQESDWNHWYPRVNGVSIPLHMDLGCHKGVYIQHLKTHLPHMAFLGLDLRKEWIEIAKIRQQTDNTTHHHQFVAMNVNISLHQILKTMPQNFSFQSVSILFCDPWFKRRHIKRRMVTVDLIKMLYNYLQAPGVIVVKSDRLEVMEHISAVMEHMKNQFKHTSSAITLEDWLNHTSQDPFLYTLLKTPTEREMVCLHKSLPIYAAVYRKCEFILS